MRRLLSKSTLLLAIFFVLSSTTFASTLWIFPSIGPADTSPSFAQYEQNAEIGIESGYRNAPGTVDSVGSGPTAYTPASDPINPYGLVSTSGFSWMGTPNPSAPFDQEHGNSLFFGLAVDSFGSTFKMKDVSFAIDIPGVFSGTQDLSGVEFSSHTVGYTCAVQPTSPADLSGCVAHNTAGGVGVDDNLDINFLFTSGIYVSDLDGNVSDYTGRTINSSYQLPGFPDANNTLSTSAVPEPGTFALLGLGLGFALRFRRKR